jgi:serine/threonine protein kinase
LFVRQTATEVRNERAINKHQAHWLSSLILNTQNQKFSMQDTSKGHLIIGEKDAGEADDFVHCFNKCSDRVVPVLAIGPVSAQTETHNDLLRSNPLEFNIQTVASSMETRQPMGKATCHSSQTLELNHENRVYSEIRTVGPRINPDILLSQHDDTTYSSNMDACRTCQAPGSESHSNNMCNIWKPFGLTLSAYRRPENTIRLTKSDPMRHLETEYDLYYPGSSGVLGHGAYSTVRLAVRLKDGVRVAVKSIAKHEALRSRRLRRVDGIGSYKYYLEEWEILRRLQDHPYVITLLDVFETTDEIQLVTEYCPGGELFDAIQKNQGRQKQYGCSSSSEKQAALITSQILQALATLHALGIVHRDVKPENILLAKPLEDDSVHVKLCDFGVARPLVPNEDVEERSGYVTSDGEASPLTPGSRSRSFSSVGTDYYAAPELTYGNTYDTAVDIYSLGVTLYILLCGFPPVFGTNNSSVPQDDDDDSETDSFVEVIFPDVYWCDISPTAKSLLRQMLHPDPQLRIDAKDAQQDPWIKSMVQATSPKFLSSIPPNYPIDLNLVRHELYKSLIGLPQHHQILFRQKRRNSTFVGQISNTLASTKRTRLLGTSVQRSHVAERRSSTTALMALADMYRGVAAPPSVIAAAAVAAASTTKDGNIEVCETNTSGVNDSSENSFISTKSPVPALSF